MNSTKTNEVRWMSKEKKYYTIFKNKLEGKSIAFLEGYYSALELFATWQEGEQLVGLNKIPLKTIKQAINTLLIEKRSQISSSHK